MKPPAPGYLRPIAKAPILYFEYKQTPEHEGCGLYTGDFLVRIGRPYADEVGKVDLRDAVKALLDNDKFQGVFVTNNEDLMAVGQGFYALCLGWKYGTEKERWKYAYVPGAGFDWFPTTHVGYIKTKPVRLDLPLVPYHLFVDDAGYTSLDYETKIHLPGAIPGATPALYKELIARDAQYVYMTESGPIFV